jgi:hypothetical protein
MANEPLKFFIKTALSVDDPPGDFPTTWSCVIPMAALPPAPAPDPDRPRYTATLSTRGWSRRNAEGETIEHEPVREAWDIFDRLAEDTLAPIFSYVMQPGDDRDYIPEPVRLKLEELTGEPEPREKLQWWG